MQIYAKRVAFYFIQNTRQADVIANTYMFKERGLNFFSSVFNSRLYRESFSYDYYSISSYINFLFQSNKTFIRLTSVNKRENRDIQEISAQHNTINFCLPAKLSGNKRDCQLNSVR